MAEKSIISRTTSTLSGLANKTQAAVKQAPSVAANLVHTATNAVHPPTSMAARLSPTPEPTAGKGYDVDAAMKFAAGFEGKAAYDQMCERFIENAYGTQHNYGSAKANYTNAEKLGLLRNDATPPGGAIVYLQGNEKHGHAAISAGNGYIYSTGINGKVERVKLSDMTKTWGPKGAYLGYAMPSKELFAGSGKYDATKTPYDTSSGSPTRDSAQEAASNDTSIRPSSYQAPALLSGLTGSSTSGVTSTKRAGALGIDVNGGAM